MVAFCKDTGIILIVEGVETKEQKKWLLQAGVKDMQGYFFGKPKPIKHRAMHQIAGILN